jgi:hypothetical protein
MIHVAFFTIKDDEEEQVTTSQMHHTPSVGEKIWLLPAEGRQSAWVVDDVAHWVSDKINHHHAAVYISPIV